ncbi:MAG TPA: GNAT family N-acetyltransferase [Allosphingosinicella sp.]|nr:GNAT family N-acetyltransferase [Allosphingosinicella sp.]
MGSISLNIILHQGLPAAIDAAALSADERHQLLRRAWFEGAGAQNVTTVTAARDDGQLLAALPLTDVGKPFIHVRAVPGSYWPFRSFPVAQHASDEEFAAFLSASAVKRALGWAWRLGPVEAGDPTVVRLLKLARRSGWSVLQRQVGTFFVLNIGEAEEDEPWPRPSTLRNIKKHEKRLAKLGPLEFRFVSGNDWSPAVFADLERIERNSWVGTKPGADAKFLDPARRRGWETVAADPALSSMLSVGVLYIGGEPVSFSFGMNCGGIRYCVATSYDQRFAKHSPGTVTGYRTYFEAARRGVRLLDLGSGDGGEKSSMGAVAGPAAMDYLFVRGRVAAALLRFLWRSRH